MTGCWEERETVNQEIRKSPSCDLRQFQVFTNANKKWTFMRLEKSSILSQFLHTFLHISHWALFKIWHKNSLHEVSQRLRRSSTVFFLLRRTATKKQPFLKSSKRRSFEWIIKTFFLLVSLLCTFIYVSFHRFYISFPYTHDDAKCPADETDNLPAFAM